MNQRSFRWMLPLLLILCTIGSLPAQKMYIWCPPDIISSIAPQAGILRDQKVFVQITDARVFSGKVVNKCSSDEIITSVITALKAAYPNAGIKKAEDGKKSPDKGEIIIAIDITAYAAHFSTATWHATTSYAVKIKDNRTGEVKEATTTVEKDKSFFNVLGTVTAKSNMKKCYETATTELLDFITKTMK